MYIVIDTSNHVTAVSHKIRYVKAQPNGTIIAAEKSEATAVYLCSNDTFYSLRETSPGMAVFYVAEVESVPENIPVKAWKLDNGVVDVDMESLRDMKALEISAACYQEIISGCDVTLSDGSVGHFSLQETDQINLTAATTALAQGALSYPYHSDGQLCDRYSAEDITAIANAATAHKLYHTTYCNHLLIWIKRAETAEETAAIIYGSELPADLKAHMAEVIGYA